MRTREVDTGSVGLGDMLLHATLDSMSYAFSVWDDDFNLVLYNQAYADMYYSERPGLAPGMTLKQICELSIVNGNHPEFDAASLHAKYIARFIETAEPGARNDYDKQVKGRVIRSTHIRTQDVGWIVTHRDITDELRQEELNREHEAQLAAQNMRFSTAVNNMSHGLCMFGPDRRLIISNKMFAEMYGLPDRLIEPGTRFAEIVAYRIENGLLNEGANPDTHLADCLEITEWAEGEQRFTEWQGGRLIAVIHKPMPDGGWVSTHQDITEQNEKGELIAERSRALEQQNMRFDAAVNNMSQGLSMYGADHRLVVCNAPFARLYDLSDDLTQPGVSFWDILAYREAQGLISQEDSDSTRSDLEGLIRAREGFKAPVRMRNGRVILINHQPMADGGWVSTHEDITEQHNNQELVEHLARHDGLTGLPNRTAFLEAMASAEADFTDGAMRAVLCLDLDRFKPINDNFGHAAGDAVLAQVAERISHTVGDTGTVARLGGDEFAALTGVLTGPEEARALAERIVAALEVPLCWEDIEVTLGASIGVALAPDDGTDIDTLMRHGDLALYAAKNGGHGSVCLFEFAMDAEQKKRRAIEAGLKQALERGEICLHYQPVMALKTNKVIGCEALMRWNSAEHGMVSPAEFIPVAEEAGLIRELGTWALHAACGAAVSWPNGQRVAVNVSPVQFKSGDLAEVVAGALATTGLAAERLELEITESLFLAENENTQATLHALKRLGVRIALDDFGTGYSSLSYLRSFPFDKIKIDRSFISSLGVRPDNSAIIRAVVDLGESLGMETTAEGVESDDQLEALRGLGCTEVQGYLVSPPLPQSSTAELLRTPPPRTRRSAEAS